MSKGKCKDCKYWAQGLSIDTAVTFNDGFGECRRHSPRGPITYCTQTGDVTQRVITSGFAPVAHDDWCGDFQISVLVPDQETDK